MNPGKRPISVSVISWFLIVGAAFTFLVTPFSMDDPGTRQMFEATGTSPTTRLLHSLLGGIANLTAGVAMLRARGWGRWLYLILTPVGISISIALYGTGFLPVLLIGLLLYGAFAILLTRRPVAEYFSGTAVLPPAAADFQRDTAEPETGSRKRIASMFLLIPGGFMLNFWFMMIFPLSTDLVAVMVLSGICGILSSALIIPGILLWGRKRWAVVFGTLLTSVGGMLLTIWLMFYQVASMEEFRVQFATIDPVMMEQMTRGCSIFGIASPIFGVLLILLQGEKDKESKRTGRVS